MGKWTPGPWKVDEKRPYLITGEASGSGRYKQGALVNLAVCGSHDGAISNEEELANMRLMAAAPKLLSALEEIEKITANKPIGSTGYNIHMFAHTTIQAAKGGAV